MSEAIHFYYRGQQRTVTSASTNRTLLQYLREDMHCTGSKEACAEGDCGACTVVLAQLQDGQLEMKSVNACIQLLPAVHGKAVLTVEDVAQTSVVCGAQAATQNSTASSGHDASQTSCQSAKTIRLHPVQQALVNCHASQCGFCTPGFVMSLWDLYQRHQLAQSAQIDQTGQTGQSNPQTVPSREQIADALSGNLCRCTGYRPIIDAAQEMFKLPRVEFERALLTEQLLALQQQLAATEQPQARHYQANSQADHQGQQQDFFWPTNLQQALQLRAEQPQAILLAGGTDIGLWITKQMRQLNSLIYLGQVKELLAMQEQAGHLEIGAAVNLNHAYARICQHYPQLQQFWQRFAGMPVRNAGTLGGNVANGSPIGDSMPWLIALGAKVRLMSLRGARELALEDFYLAYQKKDLAADELLSHILLPLPQANAKPSEQWHFRSYKLAKRFDQDISAVCAGFALRFEGELIAEARLAFGGMAATPKRATLAEQALQGKAWDEASLLQAQQMLAQDYAPLSDMRASSAYRMQCAQNLLRRFWLESRLDAPLRDDELNVFATAQSLAEVSL